MVIEYGPSVSTLVLRGALSKLTAAVAYWLERLPRKREIMGSIPGRDKPKSLKLETLVVAFPLDAQDYGNSTTTGPPVLG